MTLTTTASDRQRLETLTLPEEKLKLTDLYEEAAARVECEAAQNKAAQLLQEKQESYDRLVREKTQRIIPHLEAIVDKLALGGEKPFSGKTEPVLHHVDCSGRKYYSAISVSYEEGVLVARQTVQLNRYFIDTDMQRSIAQITIGRGESRIDIRPQGPEGMVIGALSTVLGTGIVAFAYVLGAPLSFSAPLVVGGSLALFGTLGLAINYRNHKRSQAPLARAMDIPAGPEEQYAILKFLYALPDAIAEVYHTSKSWRVKRQESCVQVLETESARIQTRIEDVQKLVT